MVSEVAPKSIKLSAFLIGTQLDIKAIKSTHNRKALEDSSTELLYLYEEGQYEYIFNYGVVVYSGFSEAKIKKKISELSSATREPHAHVLRDEHLVVIDATERQSKIEFDKVTVNRIDDKVMRIAMLNLAQSVALDKYHELTEELLIEIKGISQNLEQTGKLKLGRTELMKFIGRALNTQNGIAENIYVFDAPELVWYDEYLDTLHRGLIKNFDLRTRFSEIEYTNRIIKDNLSLYREIASHRESSALEIIIIVLILFEVFDLLFSKFL